VTSRFFENMSGCTWDPTLTYSGLNRALGNIHTSQQIMSEYPALVAIHHYGLAPARYRADIYVSETGEWKGAFAFNIAANESYVVSMRWYEQSVGWNPIFGQSHANIIFSRDDGGTYQAVVGYSIFNQEFSAYVNMTQFCGINR
jgi:hypothetical protein